jgi:hypothetical protein
MSDERRGFVELTLGVLRGPGEYFKYVEERDLFRGLIIVALMVVFAAASSSIYMSKIPLDVLVPQLGEVGVDVSAVGDVAGSMGLFSAAGAAISVLAGWTLSTLIMHGLATLAGGKGGLKRFFAMHGFAAAPHALNHVLRTVDAYVSSSQSIVAYYTANRDVSFKLLRAALNTNMVTVFGVAGLVYVTYAVAENYGVQRGRAAMIALVPVLLFFLVSYISPT